MKKIILFTIAFILCTFSFSSAASLYVCQKGTCSYIHEEVPLLPWVKKIYPFFKTLNARIDFCEADARDHFCLAEGAGGLYQTKPQAPQEDSRFMQHLRGIGGMFQPAGVKSSAGDFLQ